MIMRTKFILENIKKELNPRLFFKVNFKCKK